jgi:hypothetical protein
MKRRVARLGCARSESNKHVSVVLLSKRACEGLPRTWTGRGSCWVVGLRRLDRRKMDERMTKRGTRNGNSLREFVDKQPL